jgi:predicted metal-dependent enzyme (double-stranded beta helix superfamily)
MVPDDRARTRPGLFTGGRRVDDGAMFDLDRFLADCRSANRESDARRAIRELLDRTLDRPGEVAGALDPREAGLTLLHHADDLTVLHLVWAPGMDLYPHDHRMWAAIGIYCGQEDNRFYRRTAPGERTLLASGGKELPAGATVLLGDDTIHAVSNPTRGLTGAIHVYGGDFVNQPRSQWGPGLAEERPYDMDDTRRQFAEANAAWHATQA